MENFAINQLIESGLITVGTKARNNPASLSLGKFAMGIANKDYPAQTPFLWNSVYESLGLSARNVRVFSDAENTAKVFSAFKADSRYMGGDVGVGYKDRVLDLLDDIDPLAKIMGAINVIVKTGKGLKGYNTDGFGFAESLELIFKGRSESLHGKKVLLLGAGGTANSIAFALASRGAKVIILNRTVTKAEQLATRVNSYFGQDMAEFASRDVLAGKIIGTDAVVSIIDDPHSELDKFSVLGTIDLPATAENIARNLAEAEKLLSGLPKTIVISDVMLRSHDTATIAQAKAMGFETLDGMPMVLNQAVEAFSVVNAEALSSVGVDRKAVAKIMGEASSFQR